MTEGRPGAGQAQDDHDRRNLSESALHGGQPADKTRARRPAGGADQPGLGWHERQTARRNRRRGRRTRFFMTASRKRRYSQP